MKSFATLLMLLGLLSSANAALFSRAGGTMVYDDVLNITWLADWNYAHTSGYAAVNAGGSGTNQVRTTGEMGWDAAMAWANGLVYGGYSDWRLPTALNQDKTGPCQGFDCNKSEMGYMFYVNWGATANSPYSSGTNSTNLALFQNVPLGSVYWFSTEYSQDRAWYFLTAQGAQSSLVPKSVVQGYAVTVRDGDVAPVSVPATLALLSLGLVGVCAAPRRQAQG